MKLTNFPAARVSPAVAREQLKQSYGLTEQLLVTVAEQVKSKGPVAPLLIQETQEESEEDL